MNAAARRAGMAGWAAGMSASAGAAFGPVFPPGAVWLPVLTAAVVPAVLAVLWRRMSLWLVLLASALAWLLGSAATVLRAGATGHVLPNPATVHQALAGTADCWPALLGMILPAPAAPALLIGVYSAVWIAATAAAELVSRTSAALAAAAPGVALLGLALAVGVDAPGTPTLPVVCFLGCTAACVVLRTGPAATRSALAGGAAAILAVATAVLAGPHVPFLRDRPLDPRQWVQAAARDQFAVDPVDQVPAWLATPSPGLLFTVDTTNPQNWRVAVLEQYDGQVWGTAHRFLPTGSRVPQAGAVTPAAPSTVALSQQVSIAGLAGVWLPAADRPTSVSGVLASADPSTGVLLNPAGVHSGDRYVVRSQVPQAYSAARLRSAAVATDADALAATALPDGVAQVVLDDAQRATDGATFPYQQATRIAAFLRTLAVNDPAAPPGHTLGHIEYFLSTSHRGSSEQFATAFALMARSVGLPTRLVVGFQAGQRTPTGYAVHGSDALAWPEVDFAGVGWVAFYPTPAVSSSRASDLPPAGSNADRAQLDRTLDAAPLAQQPSTRPAGTPHPANPAAAGRSPMWTLVAGAAGALLIAYLAAAFGVPVVRRRRRRRAPGAYRVAGAWAEALDRIGPLRLGDLRTLTTAEVADRTARRLPGCADQILGLAGLADAAAFSGAPTSPEAGAQAWAYADRVAHAVRRALGVRGLLWHRLCFGLRRR